MPSLTFNLGIDVKKIRRIKLATLLIVGEGAHEKAFLQHMKSLYDGETNQTVKIDAASGGSPIEIIDETIRKFNHADYSRKVILLDSDVVIRQQDRDKARKNKIELIVSYPVCLEGMLLEILGQKVPDHASGTDCKRRLHSLLQGEPTNPKSYERLFPKCKLDTTTKEQIIRIKNLICNISG